MTRGLARAMQPLRNAVRMMLARGVVLLADDNTKLQSLQVSLLADELRDDAERFQNYGFTSVPLPGAEAVVASVAGNRDHVLVLAVDDRRYRLKALDPGEVAIYTDQGDRIVIRRGGVLEVHAATSVQINAPLVHVSGNLTVAGDISAGGDMQADGDVRDAGGAKSMAGMRSTYNGHQHGSSAGPNASM